MSVPKKTAMGGAVKQKQEGQRQAPNANSLKELRIASQEQIGEYLENTAVFFNNPARDMKENAAERAMQEKASAR